MRIKGVYPPIATPFDGQGHLHTEALASNIHKWNQTGLSGYVVAGSNGEGVLLALDELTTALSTARRAAPASKLVIAGTGRQSTGATITTTRAAADAGADAALVVTPFFYGPQMTGDALRRHFETLADASPIPIIIYNVPKFTHLNLAPATVARLSAHEKIVAIKDSAGNIGQIIDLIRLCPPDFDILVGNGPAYLSGLQAGASGGILALANVAPRECVAIWDLARSGQFEKTMAIQQRLMPVGRAVTSGYGIAGLKAALDLLGYYGGDPRPPLLPADDATRKAMRRILAESGLLP